MIRYIALVLLLVVSCSFTPSYRIYETNMTLGWVKARSYGNYRPYDTKLWGVNQGPSISYSMNIVIQFYNNKPHPFRWESQYSVEYFQDSSMTTISQILYRKVNLTHTYRYYSLRPRRGLLANKTFFLGSDTCQSCNPGRDMPFMVYNSLDIESEQDLGYEFVNIVNSAKKMGWKVEDIREVRHLQYPEGDFYLPVFQFANQSTYMASFMKTNSQALTFIEGTFFPKIKGNVAIDESYLYEYLSLIYEDRNLKLPALLHSNIIYFQYYVDPVDKQATTVMLNILNSRSYLQFFGVFQQRQFNFLSRAQYNKAQLVPYLSSPYFLQDTQNNRMGSSLTQQEYRQFARQDVTRLSNAKILQGRYIDFPNGLKQYMLTISYSSPLISNRTVLKYLIRPNTPKFTLTKEVYSKIIIFDFASPYDWEATWPKIYEYARQYGTTNDIDNYPQHLKGVSSTQICDLFSGRFQSVVWRVGQASNPQRLKRLLIKDTQTNRIFLILQSQLKSVQSKGEPDFSFCPSINIEIIDSATFDRIFSAISGQLINANGDAFLVEEMKEQLVFRLNAYGGNNVYFISFQKDGVKSAFYINQTKKGTLIIFDYIENVQLTGSNSYPSLGSADGTNSTTTPNTPTNTSKNITSNSTTQNTTNPPNQTIPDNSIPLPQIIVPAISDILISGEGSLLAQDVISRYTTLVSIIKNYDASTSLQKKPIVYVYCDRYSKVVSYAMAFSFSSNVYEVFELIQMVESKQYFYAGKTYLTNLPNIYWNISDSTNQEVMQQAFAIVNSNPVVANVPILKGTVKSIPTLKGGLFFVNMTITNGYTVNMAFLRKQIVWEKIYAYFIPPSSPNPTTIDNNNPNPNIPNPNPNPPSQPPMPTLTDMTDSQIRSDTFLLAGFSLIKDSVSQLMSGLGLSQAMKGSFSNGTLVYNLTYRSQNSSIYLNIIFYYDPISSKILYLKTDPSTQVSPIPAAVCSPTDQQMQKIVMDNTLASYPQLSGYQSANIQWSKFPAFWICNVNLTVSGVIYYRIVQIAIPSMQVQQLKFAKGGV